MISITILELLYLVLTLFVVVIGTLLTVVLLRILKILKVGTEVADMYFKCKEILGNLSLLPELLRDKFSDWFSQQDTETQEEPK